MLLLIKVVCVVLGAVTQSTMAAKRPMFTDPIFAEGFGTAFQQNQNSAEVATTLGPGNSAEVVSNNQQQSQQQNSAEVAGSTQQNSAEVASAPSTIDPFNSAEVASAPSTIDPFNSAEVTPSPTKIPSPGSSQKIVKPSSNSETVAASANEGTSNNNNQAGASVVVGTQAFYPKPTQVKQVQEEPGTAAAQPDHTQKPGTIAGTQAHYPLTINVGNEKGAGRKPSRPTVAVREPGVEPIPVLIGNTEIAADPNQEANQGESIPNSLRDALAEAGMENTGDDPLIEQAKQYFISIWNLEANRLGAPYLEVTDVWPDIGMVYMPTINQMSSKIQSSRPVKEAAERLQTIWEERKPIADSSSAGGAHVLNVLADFISSWGIGASEREQTVPHQNNANETPLRIKKPLPRPIPSRIQAASGQSSPGSNNPAHQRPAQDIHPAAHRPATRQEINSDSEESKELYKPLPLSKFQIR